MGFHDTDTNDQLTISYRLWSVVASLIFSIPTVVLVWFWINVELALNFSGFVSAPYLWYSIATFAAIGFLFPKIFPSIIGWFWKWMVAVYKWWW